MYICIAGILFNFVLTTFQIQLAPLGRKTRLLLESLGKLANSQLAKVNTDGINQSSQVKKFLLFQARRPLKALSKRGKIFFFLLVLFSKILIFHFIFIENQSPYDL
jgi:hypothetical protein